MRRKPLKILSIDNNPRRQMETARVLTFVGGHMVYGAESGQAGLKKATALKPDIILLAICILDMSGLEVIEALSADSVTQRIPVIGIIDGDLSHIESETLKRNRNLISLEKKPIDLTKLLEMVEIGPTTRIEPEGWEGA